MQRIKALKISDIDQKKIKLLVTPKKNRKVAIAYDQDPFVFQTPFLEVTVDKLRPTAYPEIYQLDTLFNGDSKSKVDKFYQLIETIESNICAQICKNCAKWFSQKDITFKSLIRESDLNKNMYYVKWPIQFDKDMFISEDGKTFNPKKLKEKDFVKFIVEIPNVWIDEERLGLACIVKKIMVKQPKEKTVNEYIFDTNSSSSEEENSNNIISTLSISESLDNIVQIKSKNIRIPEVETNVEPLRTKKVVPVKKQLTPKREFPPIPPQPEHKPRVNIATLFENVPPKSVILSDGPKKNNILFNDSPNENEFELLTDEPKNDAHRSLKVELISHKKFQQQKNKHVVISSDNEFIDMNDN